MKKIKTIAELLSSCNSRTPVEDTVVKRWDTIIDCISVRCSLAKIANALREEGENVGNKDNTGFTQAVNRVAGRKGIDLPAVRAAGTGTPKVRLGEADHGNPDTHDAREVVPRQAIFHETIAAKNTSPSGASDHEGLNKPSDRPSFGDTRYPSSF